MAAATSDFFPTTALAALSSDAAALSGALASTEFGCPESDFLSLGDVCPQTDIPSCLMAATNVDATATVTYDAACCTSISSYALGIESCFVKNAPNCLDTSALLASATAVGGADSTETNPCAPYWGGGKGSGPTKTPSPSSKAGTAAGATAAGVTAAGGATATGTSSGGSTAATQPANAATKTGAGLKVYLGLGLLGALAVLRM